MTSRSNINTIDYPQHIPVLLNQLIELVNPKIGDMVLDCTVGLGGHASSMLSRIGTKGHLIGLDLDKNALSICDSNLKKKFLNKNYNLYNLNYRDAIPLLEKLGIKRISIIILDLGFSSFQIDNPKRGFSFRLDGPLDMRLSQENPDNAKDFLKKKKPEEIEKVLVNYGEIGYKDAKIITANILRARSEGKLETTYDLRNTIHKQDLYPLVFQAIRIEVNQELASLEKFLTDIFNFSLPETKIAIISFHSLEDRIVKKFFKFWSRECICPKEVMICNCKKTHPKRLTLITKKAISPDKIEININPRARSSKLRVAKVI